MPAKTAEKTGEDKVIAARNKNLDLAIQQIAKDYGDGAIMRLGDEKIVDIDVIPTGNILIDRALGVGGFPRGRVVEVFGPESSGKTTLTLTVIAQAQKRGGLAAFIDVEHALDPQYARKLGVNLDDLLVSQPSSGEEALRICETLVRSNALDVIVVDSVAALVTRMVVRPVRVAARTAQRLSAGLLDQRMELHGEDDLARLAASFNQMAANLQSQIVRLEEMSRMQRRFTSDVSHELRTPLTTVRMAADLIFSAREEFDASVARSAELLQTELDRFESLLTDLLEISRFDAGFAMLDAEPTDLVPAVRRVVDQLRPLAERAGSRLDLDVPDGTTCVLIGPSGCGKTTTMRIVNRLIEPTAGKSDADLRYLMRTIPVGTAVQITR